MSFLSTATGVAVIDARNRSGTITLPLTSQIPNRYFQIKDLYGAFSRSSLTVSTQAGEAFDDGTTSKLYTDPFTFLTLYAASTTRWAQLGGTQTISQTISSLNVSSITIGSGLGWLQLPPIQTVAVSTNTINADTIITNSTTSMYISGQILYVSSIMGAVVGAGNLTTANLTSTVGGLGQIYISTAGGGGGITTANLVSTTANLQSAATQFVSSLTINTLTIGSGAGWLQLPPIQTIYASTTIVQGQTLYAISSYFGNTSSGTALQFNGLDGNDLNTVLAELSTGPGTQEFLVFKGSSASDRVRVQTTGTFVVETGVSSRLWPTTTSNATPALIINTSSNVGIQTATPATTLDVAGTGRFQVLSTLGLNISSINGVTLVTPSNILSTVAGLGSAGYVSTAQLNSTVLGSVAFPSTVSSVYGSSFNTFFLNPSTMSLVNIAPSSSNLWVAAGYDTNPALSIKYSTDGFTWVTASGATFSLRGQGVAYNGSQWVCVGNDTTANNTVKYSGDGRNWSNAASGGFTGSAQGIAWNGKFWLAGGIGGGNTLKYSGDGSNWSNVTSGTFTSAAYGVAWNGYMWVALGADTGAGTGIRYSYDGLNWLTTSGTSFATAGINAAWNGRMWVAVGVDSTAAGTIKYSYDGINWSNSVSGAFETAARGVAWNGRMWVVGGTGSSFLKYSYDGLNWSNAASGDFVSGTGFGVTWNGSLWMAIGQDATQNNTIKYSYNGVNWSNSSGTGYNQFGYATAYSSNTVPSYAQRYLEIAPQGIPFYFRSTNTVLALQSSIIFNNTLLVDMTDRVGINTGFPQTDLDVAGTGRFQVLSTLALTVSSINNGAFIGLSNITSTVAGLGSAGFVSTLSLVSTTYGLQTSGFLSTSALVSTTFGLQTSGFLSSPNLLSTVGGLGNAGYLSSLSNVTVVSSLQMFTSSIVGNQFQFVTVSSQALYVSSFYTATRQATPMFITF